MPSSSPGGFSSCLQRSGIGGQSRGYFICSCFKESVRYAVGSSSFVGLSILLMFLYAFWIDVDGRGTLGVTWSKVG